MVPLLPLSMYFTATAALFASCFGQQMTPRLVCPISTVKEKVLTRWLHLTFFSFFIDEQGQETRAGCVPCFYFFCMVNDRGRAMYQGPHLMRIALAHKRE